MSERKRMEGQTSRGRQYPSPLKMSQEKKKRPQTETEEEVNPKHSKCLVLYVKTIAMHLPQTNTIIPHSAPDTL